MTDEKFEKGLIKGLSKNKKHEIKLELYKHKIKGYFFLKDEDFSNYIKMRLRSLEGAYNKENIGEDVVFQPLNHVSTKYFYVFGMINIIDTKNIFLYSNINGNNEVSLKLNLDHLKRYSLFSGQVVALKGKNLGDNEFVVENIHCIPIVNLNKKELSDDFRIRIISGDIDRICLDGIDVLILIDVNIKKHKLTLEEWEKADKTRKIIIVPVLGDDFSINVYPQIMIEGISSCFVSATNPVQFTLNNKLISINTLDILSQLKKEEVTFCPKDSVKRNENNNDKCGEKLFSGDHIDRLCHHVLYQKSYLPVFMSDVNIQYDSEALIMDVCPDIYILKSKIASFKRKIGETEVINIGNDQIFDLEIIK